MLLFTLILFVVVFPTFTLASILWLGKTAFRGWVTLYVIYFDNPNQNKDFDHD